MTPPAWETYVARLCVDAWSLDPASLVKLVTNLELLMASQYVSDGSVATALRAAGVPTSEAEVVAPSIRAAIDATLPIQSPGH